MTIRIGNHLYGDKIFYRVKVDLGNRTKIFWTREKRRKMNLNTKVAQIIKKECGHDVFCYKECDKFGGERFKGNTRLLEFVWIGEDKIIYEKEARMNLHYGELEIIKEKQ